MRTTSCCAIVIVALLGASACGTSHYTFTIHPEHEPARVSGHCREAVRMAPFAGPPPGEVAEVRDVDYEGNDFHPQAFPGVDMTIVSHVVVEDPPAIILAQALRAELEARGCDVQIVDAAYEPAEGELFVTGRYLETDGQQVVGRTSYVEMRMAWEVVLSRPGQAPRTRKFAEVGKHETSGGEGAIRFEEAMEASVAASVTRAADAILE